MNTRRAKGIKKAALQRREKKRMNERKEIKRRIHTETITQRMNAWEQE